MKSTPTAASPQISFWLMILTYIVGALGLFIGFTTIQQDPPSLALATLLAVGVGGILSFVRHAVFNRSDAARMGWDLGRTNNFQIEVGIANLAWGLLAVFTVVFGWGLAAQAAAILVFGFYLTCVTGYLVVSSRAGHTRKVGVVLAMGAFGVMLIVLGVMGMNAAS